MTDWNTQNKELDPGYLTDTADKQGDRQDWIVPKDNLILYPGDYVVRFKDGYVVPVDEKKATHKVIEFRRGYCAVEAV